jgi:hypothetical protein
MRARRTGDWPWEPPSEVEVLRRCDGRGVRAGYDIATFEGPNERVIAILVSVERTGRCAEVSSASRIHVHAAGRDPLSS